MRKDIPIFLTTSLILASCAPEVVRALEAPNENDSKLSLETPPPTFVLEPSQTIYPTPYLLEIFDPTQEVVIRPNVPYFSQLDYPNDYLRDGTPWTDSTCGIMAGAMIDKTNPYIYYKDFLTYFKTQGFYGEERITKLGSEFKDHKAVLESLGHTFVEIEMEGQSMKQIKSEIETYTNLGIPVWIQGHIWDGEDWYGHHTIALGIDIDGRIIYNDPIYGEGTKIAESAEEAKIYNQAHWIRLEGFHAVFPPKK